jgi:hypothetical protein
MRWWRTFSLDLSSDATPPSSPPRPHWMSNMV